MFRVPLQKSLSRSRSEKRTEYVFYTRSKRMVGNSVITFRTKNLVNFVFQRFRSTLKLRVFEEHSPFVEIKPPMHMLRRQRL